MWYSFGINIFTFILFLCLFWGRVSLCSLGCPGTHSVNQVGLKLKDLPASASQVLPLPGLPWIFWAAIPRSLIYSGLCLIILCLIIYWVYVLKYYIKLLPKMFLKIAEFHRDFQIYLWVQRGIVSSVLRYWWL